MLDISIMKVMKDKESLIQKVLGLSEEIVVQY